ncbi:MAG: radical SAM protein, partial [Candidatus Poribacteria bacterium]
MIKALLLSMPDVVPQFHMASCLPNLGIVSIAGNIDASICDIKVADLVLARKNPESYVLSVLREQSPDVVGLSCMSLQYDSAIKFAKLIKGYDKNILVVIGGYHPTLMYEEISSSPDAQFIDFIVRGEGEATFSEFITALNSGKGYDKIEGLSYKANDRFHHNPPRALLSLDDIKMPKRDARLLKKGFHALGSPSDVVETSRGCVYGCKFCTIKYMYGRSFREYKVERVISDIKDAREHGAKSLIFADDNITLNLRRLDTICDEIISAKLNSIHYIIVA